MPRIDPRAVAERLTVVRDRIASTGVDPSAVRIVAVTKGFDVSAMVAAAECGLVDVGENYAQEAVRKLADAARPELRLHFIGRLQTNKVRLLAPHVTLWQSVDRLSAGLAIAKRVPGAAVLAQVNVSGEPTKGGCDPGELDVLVGQLKRLGLDVRGLMAIGRTGPPEEARPGFAWLRASCDRLGLRECSMGMTDDLEVAVSEGSTIVRVGSALFGMRPSAGPAELA